jgi:hypothetical protein
MNWVVKHKRTGAELARVNSIDEAINYVRANGLRVWGTDRDRRTVNVVEDERLKVQSCT